MPRRSSFDGLAPIAFDYLVFALGAQGNFFGTEGAVEHAFPMYTLRDAMKLKDHVLERWEGADKDGELVDDGALTVVVVGGGPTGVETAGALAELYRSNFVTDYPSLPQEKARVVLVEAGDEIFAMFKPNLREYAKDALEQRTVEVMTGARVKSVSPTRVTLSTDEVISAHTLVWGAGPGATVSSSRSGSSCSGATGSPSDQDLEFPGHPGVFVVGDVAAITDSKTEQVLTPQLGSVALQSGEHAGRDHLTPRRGQVDEAVRLQGQRHDGGDRAQRGSRADARREDDEGAQGSVRVADRAPRAPPDERRPVRRQSSTGPAASSHTSARAGPDGRRGRRRADRRRDGGSPRRALPVELRHGLSEPSAGEGPRRPRRGRRRDLRDVQAEPARICEGRARAADGRGHDRRSGAVGVADARDALHG